jgi:flagellar export protein FliJ
LLNIHRFYFRLTALLRLREAVRDERRVELADVQRADAELQSRLAQVAVEQEQLQGECRTIAGPGLVDLPPLVHAQRYAAALRGQEVELQRQRWVLAAEIDRRRQALIEADREVQTLEKLKQSQSAAHQQNAERQEGKRLDEAAIRAKEFCGLTNDDGFRCGQ